MACLMAIGRHAEAIATHQAALRISPHNRQQQLIAAHVRDEAAYRGALSDFIPPEQLQRGAIPVGDSHALEVAMAVWQAKQSGRRHRGELPNSLPQGVPGVVPVKAPDPNPFLKLQNELKTP
jgi:hypothetical protein